MVTSGSISAKPSVRAAMTFFIEVEPPVATLPDSAAVEEAEAAVLDAAAEEAAVEEAAPPQAVRAAAAAAAPQMDRNERRVIFS